MQTPEVNRQDRRQPTATRSKRGREHAQHHNSTLPLQKYFGKRPLRERPGGPPPASLGKADGIVSSNGVFPKGERVIFIIGRQCHQNASMHFDVGNGV